MAQYVPFFQRLSSMAQRKPVWVGRQGPVAVLWSGPRALVRPHVIANPHTDFNGTVHVFDDLAVGVAPFPERMGDFPTLDLGDIGAREVGPDHRATPAWLQCVNESMFLAAEKGYVPILVGGQPDATLAAVEGLKRVHKEDIILVHLDSQPRCKPTSGPDGAVRQILEKKLVKGVMQFGTREVEKGERECRVAHNVKSWDANAMYAMNLCTARNIRNAFPIYLSIDVSVLEPGVFGGAEKKIAGGLMLRDLLHLVVSQRAPRIVGADIVGMSQDMSATDANTVAKILKEVVQKVYGMSSMTEEEVAKEVQRMKQSGMGPLQ